MQEETLEACFTDAGVRDCANARVGWVVSSTARGSHCQFKHPTKRGLVAVSSRPGDDLAAGTLNSVLKQVGLK
ncbi:type II toxin-antitoxin system HicA family toxin [Nitrococcus mobilis]|uniref:type II toxin-antitoxin system HicA family toxin n=1 Tax=Nitrococcus mobilis TaxID=35797 RepID=UPI002FBF0127